MPLPTRGSSLFLHPAVILTAFVATALAHSEKVLAADLPSHDDQQPSPDALPAAAGKTAKLTWMDALQALLHPSDKAAGSTKAGDLDAPTGLSLASLIAIAMSAAQPVIDRFSNLSAVVDDSSVAGLASAASATNHQTAVMPADSPFFDSADPRSDHSSTLISASGDEHAAVRKMADAAPTDMQKAAIDLLHDGQHVAAIAVSVPQKGPAEEAPNDQMVMMAEAHQETAPPPFSLFTQKVVVAAVAAAAPPGTPDGVTVTPPSVSLKDVSPDALQFLTIHPESKPETPKADLTAATAPTSDVPAHPMISVNATDTPAASLPSIVAAAGVTPPALEIVKPLYTLQAGSQPAADSEVSSNNGLATVQAIATFSLSGQHDIAPASQPSADLQKALAPFATGTDPLKLVLFDGGNADAGVLQFVPGVLLVDEKYFSTDHSISNPGGDLVIDRADGSVLKLVGVVTVEHVVA